MNDVIGASIESKKGQSLLIAGGMREVNPCKSVRMSADKPFD
jgi:hypothetical protein